MSALVAVALIVAADLLVRAISPSFPPTDQWNNWEATNKVLAMKALGTRGGADIAFVGSSMMNAAADPALITRAIGSRRPAFNAALNGAGIEALDFWVLHEVVPLLHPRMVVIGVSSRELNDRASEPARFWRTMMRSPAAKAIEPSTIKDRLFTWAGDISAIVRYRNVLRDPIAAAKSPGAKSTAVDALGTLHAIKTFVAGTYAITPAFLGRVVHQTITPYSTGGRQVTVLAHLVRSLAQLHIIPVVVKMPMSPDALPLHQHGAADYYAYEAALKRFVEQHPSVREVDMAALFSSTGEFRDPFHLNARGRLKFSTLLAGHLRAL